MNIGTRTKRMPMTIANRIKWFIIYGVILMPQLCKAQIEPNTSLPIELNDSGYRVQRDTLQCSDSRGPIQSRQYAFKPKQLILPCALFAVGTFGVYNGAFRKLDSEIKKGMDNLRGTHYFRVDDYIQYLPATTYLTFGSIGIKSKHSFKERVVVGATAYLAMTAVVNVGKYSFREKRPDSDARNSFPSGHTATVFTGAELMREEYGLGLGLASYGVAAGVAFLRLYNGRHWFNDVIAGAGLGILSARIGYWMLPLYRKWFGWNKPDDGRAVSLIPGYDHEGRALSMNLAIMF